MTFDEWHTEQNKPYPNEQYSHYDWEKMAWDAALDAAVEALEHRKNSLLDMYEDMPAKEQAMLVAGVNESINAINKLRQER